MTDDRALILNIKAMTKEVTTDPEPVVEEEYDRPRTRAECVDGPRPCPYISCQHHLYLDVTEAGSIRINFPNTEVWDMEETCALDVADRGPLTLKEVGSLLNLTRERARQLEARALVRLKVLMRDEAVKIHLPVLSDDSRG